jgi:hypothetical protein
VPQLVGDGIPDADLEVCDGKQVFILLDADMTTNRDVYDAAMKLRRAAKQEKRRSVAYCTLAAGGTNGLDDVLGRKREERRTSTIEALMADAHTKEKPCSKAPDAKPKKRTSSGGAAQPVAAADGTERPVIYVDSDRWEVINDITTRLLERWDATRLFCHGEVLSQLIDEGEGPKMRPLTEVDGTFYDVLQETAATAKKVVDYEGFQIGVAYTWPDGQTVKAARSRAQRFAKLEVIARSPFVRVDGTICQCNGYDAASQTMVVMDEALTGLDVPEAPTPEEVAAAVSLILEEWLGDFPFPDQENRANALALVLTPFVRALMDVCRWRSSTRTPRAPARTCWSTASCCCSWRPVPAAAAVQLDDDEFRKTLTSAFRQGPRSGLRRGAPPGGRQPGPRAHRGALEGPRPGRQPDAGLPEPGDLDLSGQQRPGRGRHLPPGVPGRPAQPVRADPQPSPTSSLPAPRPEAVDPGQPSGAAAGRADHRPGLVRSRASPKPAQPVAFGGSRSSPACSAASCRSRASMASWAT